VKVRRLAVACLISAALLVGPRPVLAKFPVPYYSFVSRPVVVCPAGDSLFVFIGRNMNNNPSSFCEVTLDFSHCPDFRLCPLRGGEPYEVDPTGPIVAAASDLVGSVAIAIRGGGAALRDTVRVFGDGVLEAIVGLASPDLNGDLKVDAQDEAIARSLIGTADRSADFDRDGIVTDRDVAVVHAHLGHSADPATSTPVASGSWGRIKRLYR
jgi:hypothetical protein